MRQPAGELNGRPAMDGFSELQPPLKESGFPSILARIWSEGIRGELVIEGETAFSMGVTGGQVVFIDVSPPSPSFYEYLAGQGVVESGALSSSGSLQGKDDHSLFRTLVGREVIGYRELWEHRVRFSRGILMRGFRMRRGKYRIQTPFPPERQHPNLHLPLTEILRDGILKELSGENYRELISSAKFLFLNRDKAISEFSLHPLHMQVVNMIRSGKPLKTVLGESLLREGDACRLLFLLQITGITDRRRREGSPERAAQPAASRVPAHFKSYEEVLDYYNHRFQILYRYFSKKIGPVAHSLLSKAVQSISDRLPAYLQEAEICSDGSLKKKDIVKKVWYFSFHETVDELVSGLQEIFHSQMHMVREHLGPIQDERLNQWIEK